MRKTFLLLLCAALLLPTAFAADNIMELKINSITTPVQAGAMFDFSFSAGNMSGPACAAHIEYWFDKDGEKHLHGEDTLSLGVGETTTQKISMVMPSTLQGVRNFFLQLKCNEASVVASRVIEINPSVPVTPEVTSLDILSSGEGKEIEFNYTIKTTQPITVPIAVEETIEMDGEVIWKETPNVTVTGQNSFRRYGPMLAPGSYKLVVEAKHGSETAAITRHFNIGAPFNILQLLAILVPVLLLFIAGVKFRGYFGAARKRYEERGIFGEGAPAGAPAAAPSAAGIERVEKAEEGARLRNRVSVVESENAGAPPVEFLITMLNEAGISAKEKVIALELAGRILVKQTVKSFIVMEEKGKMRFETNVTISVNNTTNRNWLDMVFLAKIPQFLGETIEEISADTEIQPIMGGPIVKFVLPKVGAMQSASVTYSVPKLISQAEANSVQLPAVASFKESEPLIVTQVKMDARQGAEAQKAGFEKIQDEIEKAKREYLKKKK